MPSDPITNFFSAVWSDLKALLRNISDWFSATFHNVYLRTAFWIAVGIIIGIALKPTVDRFTYRAMIRSAERRQWIQERDQQLLEFEARRSRTLPRAVIQTETWPAVEDLNSLRRRRLAI